MRPIDADLVVKQIAEKQDKCMYGREDVALYQAIQVIRNAPTLDCAPVKRGKWLINSDGYYPYCSECKEEPPSGKMTDFCPKCGADMRYRRGEENDN